MGVHDSRSQKDNLKQAEAAEEARLVRSQREYLELELRRFRRRRMLALHHKEQELLREVQPHTCYAQIHLL